MGISWKDNKYPDGRFKTVHQAFCALRPYGEYEVRDYSADTLVPERTSENFEELKPWLMRLNGRKYYIGAFPKSDVRKKKKKDDQGKVIEEEETPYNYLPVYSSLNFGSLCVARLCEVEDEKDVWLGTVNGYTVKVDLTPHSYEKKDGEEIHFAVAQVTYYASGYRRW